MTKLKVGIVGSQFAASLHAESYRRFPSVQIEAVAALDNLEEFSTKYKIPNTYKDYRKMFKKKNWIL